MTFIHVVEIKAFTGGGGVGGGGYNLWTTEGRI